MTTNNQFKTQFIAKSSVRYINDQGSRHVALIEGGMSAEREVSFMGSASVAKTLVELGYRVTAIDMGADISNVLLELKPDLVFNCLHGTYGEDGCLPALLNILRIPYTHSGVLASAIGMNKVRSKDLFKALGLHTADSIIVSKTDHILVDPLQRPYVIKPISEGSSIGVEVIFEEDDFEFKNYDFAYGDKIIVEKYIKAREVEVAVLNGKALGIIELKPLKHRFYDYDSKYTDGMTQHILPPVLPKSIEQELLKTSEIIFDYVGCTGIVRVDFLYSEQDGKCYVLEFNTHPGITSLSLCPEIAASVGIDFSQYIQLIIDSASYE